MASFTDIDDLVHSVTLYVPRPFLLHGYILPFLIIYGSWLYGWIFVYDPFEYYEAGLVGIAAIGLCQLLCCLCCHWSVHVQCFLTCNRVMYFLYCLMFKFWFRNMSILNCRQRTHSMPKLQKSYQHQIMEVLNWFLSNITKARRMA